VTMNLLAKMISLFRPPARCMKCYQDPCIGGADCPK